MTGSVAIDVVIGLVFIYLLYSLLATIIMEIISNSIGLRARNLKHSIKRMLADDEFSTHWFWKTKVTAYLRGIYLSLLDLVGYEPKSFRKGRLVFNAFFRQPSIKYLSHGGLFSKPSYISAENFSKALMDYLKNNNSNLPVLEQIKKRINKISRLSKETGQHLQSLLDDAQDDLEKFKASLEDWFDDTQARSIAWFKRNNQTWLLIIGFVMAVAMNANTIDMAKKLAVDPDARQQLVEMAIASTEATEQKLIEVQKYSNKDIPDSLKQKAKEIYQARIDSLNELRKLVEADIESAHEILGLGWDIPEKLKFYKKINPNADSLKRYTVLSDSITIEDAKPKEKKLLVYVLLDSARTDDQFIQEAMVKELSQQQADKGEICIDQWDYKWAYVFFDNNIWGFLITALAISLGAPFWFDLLNKLMKLRGSVQTATASAPKSSADKREKTPTRVG